MPSATEQCQHPTRNWLDQRTWKCCVCGVIRDVDEIEHPQIVEDVDPATGRSYGRNWTFPPPGEIPHD